MRINITLPLGEVSLAGRTLADFRERLGRATQQAIKVAARSSEARLKAITPVSKRPWERTPGGLRDSMRVYDSMEGMKAVWGTDYASYIDKGTPAHAVTGNMHWQPGPGVWGHSKGHMIRGIAPHNLKAQAEQIMKEELELALFTLILSESRGIS